MSILRHIQHWLWQHRERNGADPITIPLSPDEVHEVMESDSGPFVETLQMQSPRLFNIDLEVDPFAIGIRENRLKVPVEQYLIECSIDEAMQHNTDYLARAGVRQIKTRILADMTRLEISFEWDPWARIKKFFNRPVRHRTARIDCKVLYPYCKVQFPHNRHTLHAKCALNTNQ